MCHTQTKSGDSATAAEKNGMKNRVKIGCIMKEVFASHKKRATGMGADNRITEIKIYYNYKLGYILRVCCVWKI